VFQYAAVFDDLATIRKRYVPSIQPSRLLLQVRYHALHAWYHHDEYVEITSDEDDENKTWASFETIYNSSS
jgi:hypothetical protein